MNKGFQINRPVSEFISSVVNYGRLCTLHSKQIALRVRGGIHDQACEIAISL